MRSLSGKDEPILSYTVLHGHGNPGQLDNLGRPLNSLSLMAVLILQHLRQIPAMSLSLLGPAIGWSV